MTVLVFGKTGQLASELMKLEKKTKYDLVFFDRQEVNLLNPNACSDLIIKLKPNAVINAAAWTGVDVAEIHERDASLINGESPGAMARACNKLSIPILHISSDYVFSGDGNIPWKSSDLAEPLGAYGRSKLLGEKLVHESGARYIILRTSWVFSSHGSNFVKTMFNLGKKREFIDVVCDQIGGPTSAKSIANTSIILVEALLNGDLGGIYHFSGAPNVSWEEFARTIMIKSGINCKINSIFTKDYPTQAPRPLNSRLNGDTLLKKFNIKKSDWISDLEEVISELQGIRHEA